MAEHYLIVGDTIQSTLNTDLEDYPLFFVDNSIGQYFLVIGDVVTDEILSNTGDRVALSNQLPVSLINRKHIKAIRNQLGYSIPQILEAFGLSDMRKNPSNSEVLDVANNAKSLISGAHIQNLINNTGYNGGQIINKLGLIDAR